VEGKGAGVDVYGTYDWEFECILGTEWVMVAGEGGRGKKVVAMRARVEAI